MFLFLEEAKAQSFSTKIYLIVYLNFQINLKLHITGLENKDSVQKIYNDNQMDADVLEFSFNMEKLYDWSDIIISRSGSMTVSEICKSGRSSILVPFLYATDNHQYFNAKYLKDNNAAIIIEENDNFSMELEKNLTKLYRNQGLLLKLAINGKNLFPNDSSAIILEIFQNLMKNSITQHLKNNLFS